MESWVSLSLHTKSHGGGGGGGWQETSGKEAPGSCCRSVVGISAKSTTMLLLAQSHCRSPYLELGKADRQIDQPVVEQVQVLEVNQTAEVSGQLLQFVLTQVQLHQVCEATEVRLGAKGRQLSLSLLRLVQIGQKFPGLRCMYVEILPLIPTTA